MVKKTASGEEHKTGHQEITERLQEALDGLVKDWTEVFKDDGKI